MIAGFDGVDPGVVAVPLGSADEVALSRLRIASFTHDGPGQPAPQSLGTSSARSMRSRTRAPRSSTPRYRRISTRRSTSRSAIGGVASSRGPRPTTCSGTGTDSGGASSSTWRRSTWSCARSPAMSLLANHRSADYVFMLPASLTGAPAATVPTGFDGPLPIAVQLVGRKWEDATVLSRRALSNARRPARRSNHRARLLNDDLRG